MKNKMKIEQLKKNLRPPKGKIDVVLDTDAYNEIDDQFAITYMMRSKDKLNVKAISAAPFYNENSISPEDGMEKSYNEINMLLKMIGEEGTRVNVFRGARMYLKNEHTPVVSDASEYLAKLADLYTSEKPLYVVGIGAITNIASAILLNPDIVEKIVVVWLGGHSRDYKDTAEFNMKQDIAAARVVFNSGVPLIQLPCRGVVSNFSISKQELEYWLKGKNEVCDYLVEHTLEAVSRYIKSERDWTRIIWDATAIGWILDEDNNFMESRIVKVRMPTYENTYEREKSDNLMGYVYYIERDNLMRNMIDTITK